ncbi:MAG: 6-phosphogluconolactonase [Candidatus Acidiferrum sp.]
MRDGNAIARQAAEEFIAAADSAVKEKGRFDVALAGGSTPKTLYSLLVEDSSLRSRVPWDKIQMFFGDERHVSPDHADSNFRMAVEAMISKSPLKPEQVNRIHGEYPDTEQAAREYEQTIRKHFRLVPGEFPQFDLMLMGMGDEGHTLSLFPGTKALHAPHRIVVGNWVGKLYAERITMTAEVAQQAALVIFMVTRADKAPALKAVLEGPYEPEQLPAQSVRPKNGTVLWLVDTDAGSMLSAGIRE